MSNLTKQSEQDFNTELDFFSSDNSFEGVNLDTLSNTERKITYVPFICDIPNPNLPVEPTYGWINKSSTGAIAADTANFSFKPSGSVEKVKGIESTKIYKRSNTDSEVTIKGIRGFVVSYQQKSGINNYNTFKVDGEVYSTPVCQTIGFGFGDKTYQGQALVPYKIKANFEKGKYVYNHSDVNKASHKSLLQANPIGSRGESCATCRACGHHVAQLSPEEAERAAKSNVKTFWPSFKIGEEQYQNVYVCGTEAYVYFIATEFGIYDTKRKKIDYKPVSDFCLIEIGTDAEGEEIEIQKDVYFNSKDFFPVALKLSERGINGEWKAGKVPVELTPGYSSLLTNIKKEVDPENENRVIWRKTSGVDKDPLVEVFNHLVQVEIVKTSSTRKNDSGAEEPASFFTPAFTTVDNIKNSKVLKLQGAVRNFWNEIRPEFSPIELDEEYTSGFFGDENYLVEGIAVDMNNSFGSNSSNLKSAEAPVTLITEVKELTEIDSNDLNFDDEDDDWDVG